MCVLLVFQEYCTYMYHVELVGSTSFFLSTVCDHLPDVLFCVEQHGVMPNWMKLGVYLRIPLSKLEVIEADRDKVDSRMMAMLDLWLKTGTATKQGLINALRKTTKSSAD